MTWLYIAGSDNFSSLVVMSKGTKWTQQSYKVDSTFPYEWIKKKWRENFHVTSIGTAGSPATKQQWAVVMSRDTEFRHQVVEFDFQYPSEGIHYHWDKGALPPLILKGTPCCRGNLCAEGQV